MKSLVRHFREWISHHFDEFCWTNTPQGLYEWDPMVFG